MRFHFQVRTGTHVMVRKLPTSPTRKRIGSKWPSGLDCSSTIMLAAMGEDWQMDVTNDKGLVLS